MFTVIIPSRYSSTRLPGKPLALINDKPMIQHVVERAQQSAAKKVIVATDDQRIFDAVKAFGAEVCMTAEDHVSGTDRIHEVSQKYQLGDSEIVVNVQGDEPLIPPNVINQVAENLYHHADAAAATLSEMISEREEFDNPNAVKVVSDSQGYALYFSRAAIPFFRDQEKSAVLAKGQFPQRHIGIYAYRVSLLNLFVQWPVAPLEAIESLEQLRILSNGKKIHVSEAIEAVPAGIDTPEDLERINHYFNDRAV
ncbi:MAG: 3-deoxy-manno-octulosonate cytidylyltransferase [Cellvibrionaceae bacterium]